MKTFFYTVMMIFLSVAASTQFCGRLETTSAARAARKNNKGRALDLGMSGRLVLIVVNLAIFFLMAWLSKLVIPATIVALVLSVTMTGLSGITGAVIGFSPFFCIWLAIVWSSLFSGKLDTSSAWGWIYILLQIILLAIIYIAGRVGGSSKSSGDTDDDDEDDDEAEEVEEVVKKAAKKASGSDPEKKEKTMTAIVTIAVIVAAFIIGFVLEVKFDFFPPYNH